MAGWGFINLFSPDAVTTAKHHEPHLQLTGCRHSALMSSVRDRSTTSRRYIVCGPHRLTCQTFSGDEYNLRELVIVEARFEAALHSADQLVGCSDTGREALCCSCVKRERRLDRYGHSGGELNVVVRPLRDLEL